MKIEVFQNKFEGQSLNGERLEAFLKGIKSDLTVSYIADQGENLLFEKTLILAKVVQQLWNELEDLKESK